MKINKLMVIVTITVTVIAILIAVVAINMYREMSRKNSFNQEVSNALSGYSFIDSIVVEPDQKSGQGNSYVITLNANPSFNKLNNDQKCIKLEEIDNKYFNMLLKYMHNSPEYKKMDYYKQGEFDIWVGTMGAEVVVNSSLGQYKYQRMSLDLPDHTRYAYVPPITEYQYKCALIAQYCDIEISKQLKLNNYEGEQSIENRVFSTAEVMFKVKTGEVYEAWYNYSGNYTEIINRWEKENSSNTKK